MNEDELHYLKQDAKRLKKQTQNLTHTQALEIIARARGFNSYRAALASLVLVIKEKERPKL